MDDTLEKEAPKAKAKTGKGSARKTAGDASAAKARAKRTKADEAKPAVARKAKSDAVAETKGGAKKTRAPAKARQPKQAPSELLAALAPPPTISVHADAPLPEPRPAATAIAPMVMRESERPAGDVTIHPVEPHKSSVHPHDKGLEFGLSPVDLAPDAGVREEAGLGWFTRVLALSSVLLVLFNSFAIDKWSREQPVTRWNSQVLVAVHQLHTEMKRFHLDAPLEGMRSVWHGIRDARWSGSTDKRNGGPAGNNPPM
jgi:hypothetical protein